MDYEYFHEKETIVLLAPLPQKCMQLWNILRKIGFTLDEDVFYISRGNRGKIWQSDSLCQVKIYLGEKEIQLTREEAERGDHTWDRIQLSYLLATLPVECIAVFLEKADQLSQQLCLPMRHRNEILSAEALKNRFLAYADEVMTEVGDSPGSEGVAILIELSYPRFS